MNDKSDNEWASMSDKALSESIGAFIKHHRISRNKTQEEISSAAGISRSTLSLLERGKTVTLSTLIQVLRVLDLLYVMETFHVNTQISPIKLAEMEHGKRQRARGSKDKQKDKPESDW